MRGIAASIGTILLALEACSNPTTTTLVASLVPVNGVLFEGEYINYAWAPTFRGFVIDSAGTIHTCDLGDRRWTPADTLYVTAAELQEKYAHDGREDGTVSAAALAQMTALVPQAAAGAPGRAQWHCADAGVVTFSV